MSVLLNYTKYGRYYHNFAHVGGMFMGLYTFFPEHDNNQALKYAIAYHDCIYEAGAQDNEFRSAIAAGEELKAQGVYSDTIREAQRLIMLTQTHTTSDDDEVGKVIIDLDLAGLGSIERFYDRNTANVRKEYWLLSDEAWKAGRKQFIQSFLERDNIFLTEKGREMWQLQARVNMTRELKALGD